VNQGKSWVETRGTIHVDNSSVGGGTFPAHRLQKRGGENAPNAQKWGAKGADGVTTRRRRISRGLNSQLKRKGPRRVDSQAWS